MKTRLHLCTALAVLGSNLVLAQNETKPGPPQQPRPQESPRPALRRAPMTRPAVFLGVATSPVPPVLAAQLNLPEGFGLVVDQVMPDSPAAKAGVQQFDVLRLFNDQQLLEPQQLATLVRAQSQGSEVTLTLLRKGQEQKVTMKISERASLPERRPMPELGGEMKERMEWMKEGIGEGLRKMQEQMRDYEKRLREYQERLKNRPSTPDQEAPKPPGGRSSALPEESAKRSSATAKATMKDESGEITVTSVDGHRHLVARDANGQEIFDGSIDTPEQIKALPEDLRKKLRQVQIQTKSESAAPERPARLGAGRNEE